MAATLRRRSRTVTLVFIIPAAILAMAAVAGMVHFFRLSYYRIETGSMQPDFPVGTIVIDSARLPLRPHQVITFDADGETVTHVLVGYNADGSLITRGTANPVNDRWQSPLSLHDVRGRVVLKVLAGAPSFWASRHGIFAGCGVVLVAGAAYAWQRRRSSAALT